MTLSNVTLRKSAGMHLTLLSMIFALICALGFFLNPYSGDDLWFMFRAMNFVDVNGNLYVSGLLHYAAEQYEFCDQRLSNVLFLLLILIPKWVTALVSGISVFVILRVGCRLADMRTWEGWTLFALLFSLLFPWTDQMYLANFQVNYLWPCAGALLLISHLQSTRSGLAAIILLSLFTGLMNEAISFPLAAALTCALLMRRKKAGVRLIISWSILMACVLWITLCHPYFARLNTEGWFATRQSIVYVYLLPTLLYYVLSAFAIAHGKVTFRNSEFVLTLTIVTVSAAMMTYSLYGPRVGSLGILMSFVGVCRMLKLICNGRRVWNNRNFRRVRTGLSVLSALFLAMHYAAVAYYAEVERRSTELILERYRSPGYHGETIFAPFTLRGNVSLLALQKPYFDVWAHGSTIVPFRLRYGRDSVTGELRPLSVAPEKLHRALAEGDTGESLPDTPDFRKVAGDLLIGPYTSEEYLLIDEDYGDRRMRQTYHVVQIPIGEYSIRQSYPGDTICWYYSEHSNWSTIFPSGSLQGLYPIQ